VLVKSPVKGAVKEVNVKAELPKIARLLLDRAIDRSTIVATKIVGSGQFGKVYLAKQKKANGEWVPRAVKVVVGDANPENDALFVRETATLAPLDHPNINKLVGVCFSARPWLAVLELAEYGDLRKCLQNFRRKRFQLHPYEQLHLCRQIASGLQYLHGCRMVHRDIALRNILLGTDSCAKIADFGHARKYDEGQQSFLMLGVERVSVKWAPIEIFTSGDKHFNEATDAWSFGVTMWEILSYSKNPYEDLPPTKVPRAVKDGFRLPNPGCPSHIHKFMLKCWETNPEERLRFSQIEGFISNRMTAIKANDPSVKVRDIMADYCKKHTGVTKTLTGVVENSTPTTPSADRQIPATPAAATPVPKMTSLGGTKHRAAPPPPQPSGLGRVSETAKKHSKVPTECNECTSELMVGNWYQHNEVGFGVCRKCYYTAFSQEQAQLQFTWVDVAVVAPTRTTTTTMAAAAFPTITAPTTPGAAKSGGAAAALRRAAMTNASRSMPQDARLSALAQAMGGISPNTQSVLKSKAGGESPQAPTFAPPALTPDMAMTPLIGFGSTPMSVDSPMLFFAAPPAPPPDTPHVPSFSL
jgi:serine/threonine protein kinase